MRSEPRATLLSDRNSDRLRPTFADVWWRNGMRVREGSMGRRHVEIAAPTRGESALLLSCIVT